MVSNAGGGNFEVFNVEDVGPQKWEEGYLVGVESIYLGTAADQAADNDYHVSIVLECTSERLSKGAAMSLALSQQWCDNLADRNMMLTVDEYMAIRRLIDSERESEGATLSQEKPKRKRKQKLNSYQRWMKTELPKLRRKHPRMKQPRLMEEAARIWRAKKRKGRRWVSM